MDINKQFVFIIGAPRSGSTWLHAILSSHPEVASTNAELTVFSRYINNLVKHFELESQPIKEGKWTQGLPHLWTRKEFDVRIDWLINQIYSSLTILPSHKIILDKHPIYSYHIDLIHYYIPNAKFIHIIRDGRDVAYSWHKAFDKLGFGNSDFAGACIDWIQLKNSAQKAKKFGSDNYLEIHYEKLLQNTNEQLLRIFKFCSIDSSINLVNKLATAHSGEKSMTSSPDISINYEDRKSGNPIWKKRLSKEQQYAAKVLMGQELINEGYEKNFSWGLSPIESVFYQLLSKAKSSFKLLKQIKKILS